LESTNKGIGKNTFEDMETELYSLHYFIDLACQGETVALDMLHAPKNLLITSSPIWEDLVSHRDKFYTKNLKAFVGFARSQANKYGVKGSRLNAVVAVFEFLESQPNKYNKLSSIWDKLPIGEHIHKYEDEIPRMYQVCGRKFQDTVLISYAINAVRLIREDYGFRSIKAAENKGIDWKAVSHAFRVAYEVKELLTEGRITFPLKNANYIKSIKIGEVKYQDVSPVLDLLMNEIEELMEKSSLPVKVDREYWNDWLITILEAYIFRII
jgi:hypothetical protein